MCAAIVNESATPSPAEVYDEHFVPALFQQWGDVVATIAGVERGHHVLDVACGTGVLACAASRRTGPGRTVVGLDANDDMLAVARRKSGDIEWRNGRAESLPFSDASFDRVVSQFGFMFFEDHRAALREAMRVLRADGALTVAVCDALDHSPGYAVLAELLHRLFGQSVADAFRAPFSMGDRRRLLSLCAEADISGARVERREGTVRFPSIESLVSTEQACVWTLGGLLDHGQFECLLEEASESLRPFLVADGAVEFVMPVLILSARKQATPG